MIRISFPSSIGLFLAVWIGLGSDVFADPIRAYIGTYTRGDSEGIYIAEFDPETGRLERKGVAKGVDNPSFLAVHPTGSWLYAVNEVAKVDGEKSGAISSFAIDRKSGELRFLDRVLSGGSAPCHIVVDRAGRHVLTANYSGGNVSVHAIEKDGSLGERTAFVQHTGSSVKKPRQAAPHAHSINLDATQRFAIAADLGLDKLLVYRFDAATGSLRPAEPAFARVAPAAGPRHFDFHPNGRLAYAINEMDSTVTAFRWSAREGKLDTLQTLSTLPEEFTGGNSTADIHVHPNGRFVYGSNRGHDSIVVFAIDEKSGKLSRVENEPTGGRTPRNFNIDPTGRWLLAANQSTNTIVSFRIDEKSGELEPVGQVCEVPTPVCIQFLVPID